MNPPHSDQPQRGAIDPVAQADIVDAKAKAALAGGHRRRVAHFVAVGTLAAGVHWCVVVALVETLALAPLAANVGGWLVAFGVSFTGHHRLTFRDHAAPVARSALRFFAVSAAGFAVNEAMFAWLLGHSGLPYALLLALVLVAVAAATYLLSRHWAFLRA